jgi:hypothetical protein
MELVVNGVNDGRQMHRSLLKQALRALVTFTGSLRHQWSKRRKLAATRG